MIIVVQNNDKKRFLIKSLSVVSLLVMFWLYYGHMSTKFEKQNEELIAKIKKEEIKTQKRNSKAMKIEKEIYEESLKIVKLLNQKHIQSIKIVKNKLLIVCDLNTDIEPVLIRYGVNAMVKTTQSNIKLALDINTIAEKAYES